MNAPSFALELHAYDSDPAKALRLVPTDIPAPGEGEVTLHLIAAPIHPADLNLIEGRYGIRPDLPYIPGNEGVFRVAALGPGVTTLAVGTLVLPLAKTGTWRTALTCKAADCLNLPEGIDPLQAAQIRVNPATAWRMLQDFVPPQPGGWVLQNASNSAVGRGVIQLAKTLGLKTANLVRRPELVDELKALGADLVLEDTPDAGKALKSQLKEHGAQPLLALNAVGGESAGTLAKSLAFGGTLVTYGAMSKKPLTLPNGLLIFNDLKAAGFWITRWYQRASREDTRTMLASLACASVDKRWSLPVEKTFPLTDWQEAIALASTYGRAGKVLFQSA